MMSFLPSDIHQVHEVTIYPAPCPCEDCQNSFYLPQEQHNPRLAYRGSVSDSDARRTAAQYVQDAQRERESTYCSD